jgi:hypothetical protein
MLSTKVAAEILGMSQSQFLAIAKRLGLHGVQSRSGKTWTSSQMDQIKAAR